MKQNINYIGSKYSLLDFLYEKIKLVGNLEEKVFCDLFAGTNIVGMYFNDKVKQIISNDIEYYSFVLAKKYLNSTICDFNLMNELNNLPIIEGDIFNYYSENGICNRKYFSEENGKKIDAIRQKIEEFKECNLLDNNCYYFYIASLIEAADKIANTTSVYGSYLKSVKKSAQKQLLLKYDSINFVDKHNNINYNEDANVLITKISGDILYIDPPYNHRQYGSNYHILNAIAKYDFTNEPKGVTGMLDYNKSSYSQKTKVKETFEELIKNAKFQHIFISYNNEGILSKDDFTTMLKKYGNLKIYEKDYKTYKADSNRNNKSKNVIEYLFYLKKW